MPTFEKKIFQLVLAGEQASWHVFLGVAGPLSAFEQRLAKLNRKSTPHDFKKLSGEPQATKTPEVPSA